MVTNKSTIDLRRNLEKLSEIQADISKMLAVHEQRLGQHEKVHFDLATDVEKRRLEIHEVTGDLYTAIDEKTERIMTELRQNYDRTTDQHSKLRDRLSRFEKFIWMALGASVAVSWLFSFAVNIHKLI
jgi:ribosome-associated translation inhibitor RaiA